MPKNNIRLSVIIPVYNVSPYLEQCLQALLHQGLDSEDFEVIMVNDGSTDGSELIAAKWSANHPNYKLVSQKNAGLSAARNKGLSHARGEYIIFLDSDDIVPPNAYGEMLDIITKSGSDIITGSVHRFHHFRTWPFRRTADLYTKTRTKLKLAKNPEYIRDSTPWNKMYRHAFFKKTGVLFPDGRIYEDVATSPKLYCAAKTFDVYSKPAYYWRVNRAGITQTIKPVKATDRLWAVEQILKYFKNNPAPKKVIDEYKFAIVDYNLRWVYLDLWNFENSVQIDIINRCSKILQSVDDSIINKVPDPIGKWSLLAKHGKIDQLHSILKNKHNVADDTIKDKTPIYQRSIDKLKRYKGAVKRRLVALVNKIKRRTVKAFIFFVLRPVVSIIPLDNRRILAGSYWGNKVSTSSGPFSVIQRMAERKLDYHYVLLASKHKRKEIEDAASRLLAGYNVRFDIVTNGSLKYYYNLWRSKYLINDVNFQSGMSFRGKYLFPEKRPGQVEVQTTHGIPLKKMGIDSVEAIPEGSRAEFLAKSKRYDYLVASSPLVADLFSKSHAISPSILKTGLPQNDFLFNKYSKSDIESLKKKYGLSKDKKIILYTPTFRYGNGAMFRYLIDFNQLYSEFGDNYQIVIKTHPFNHTNLNSIDFANHIDNENANGFIKLFGKVSYTDMRASLSELVGLNSKIPWTREDIDADINELMLVSDAIILDYSSIMFSYAHLDKPAIFFTPDIDYYNSTRGSYFDIDKIAPGAIAKNTSDIVSAIHDTSDPKLWAKKHKASIVKFKSKFLEWEKGNASDKIIDELGL